jgi:phosphinothricin acetyltransferase
MDDDPDRDLKRSRSFCCPEPPAVPDIQLRPFQWSDIPAITAIYRHYVQTSAATFDTEAPPESAMAEKFGHILDLDHPLIVAAADREVQGYAYASFYRPRPAYRFTCEDSIYLRPEAGGRGLGTLLLGELIARSRAAGFRQMIAVITEGTGNSIRLHEKFGFQQVGRHAAVGFKFDRWLATLHLQLEL